MEDLTASVIVLYKLVRGYAVLNGIADKRSDSAGGDGDDAAQAIAGPIESAIKTAAAKTAKAATFPAEACAVATQWATRRCPNAG